MNIQHKNNTRMANFELLRIFSMFLIVLHHCVAHGIFSYWHDNSSIMQQIRNFVCFFLGSGGEIGVTLFVLLSGYFSCKKKFRFEKCVNIYLKTCFYSIVIFLSFLFIDPTSVKINYSLFFPLTQGGYWFITSWILMFTFSPFLNLILERSSSSMIKNYLIYGAILWVVLPTFDIKIGYSSLIYFMYLYLLGGSLRFGHIIFKKKHLLIIIAVLWYLLTFTMTSFFFIGEKINLWSFWKYIDVNSIYVLIFSLWLFNIFKDFKLNNPTLTSCINKIATSMFGVYLLHNHDLIRMSLWHKWLKMDIYMESFLFIAWALVVSISIFCLCIILDIVLSSIYTSLTEEIEKKLSFKKHF